MSQQLGRFDLQIPEPCRESWVQMTPSGKGRHCSTCDRKVHDFTELTSKQIEALLHASGGHLCARVTRNSDGSLRTRIDPAPHIVHWVAAGILVSAGSATAQSHHREIAAVSGTITHPPSPYQDAQPRDIRFVEAGKLVFETQADAHGRWRAELPAGTYDIVFGGPLFGERVNDVVLHSGAQEFAPVNTRFAFSHLGVERNQEASVTVGALTATISNMSFRYAARHPIAYLAMVKRRIERSF